MPLTLDISLKVLYLLWMNYVAYRTEWANLEIFYQFFCSFFCRADFNDSKPSGKKKNPKFTWGRRLKALTVRLHHDTVLRDVNQVPGSGCRNHSDDQHKNEFFKSNKCSVSSPPWWRGGRWCRRSRGRGRGCWSPRSGTCLSESRGRAWGLLSRRSQSTTSGSTSCRRAGTRTAPWRRPRPRRSWLKLQEKRTSWHQFRRPSCLERILLWRSLFLTRTLLSKNWFVFEMILMKNFDFRFVLKEHFVSMELFVFLEHFVYMKNFPCMKKFVNLYEKVRNTKSLSVS